MVTQDCKYSLSSVLKSSQFGLQIYITGAAFENSNAHAIDTDHFNENLQRWAYVWNVLVPQIAVKCHQS